MTMIRCFFLIYLIFPGILWGGTIHIVPAEVPAGGAAVLHYVGPPVAYGVARFGDALIHLSPTEYGAAALLGIELEAEPGDHTVRVMLSDPRGRTFFEQKSLRVYQQERLREHLTLPKQMVSPQAPEILRRIDLERRELQTLFRRITPGSWPGEFHLPVSSPVSSVFGLQRILNGTPRSPHSGVDFRSPSGTPVKAPAPGRIAFAGDLYYTGKTIILDHGEGLYSLFAHLQAVETHQDQPIRQGEVLGKTGSTGRSTGPHLHWGIVWRGKRIDPLFLTDILSPKNLDSFLSRGDN